MSGKEDFQRPEKPVREKNNDNNTEYRAVGLILPVLS